MLERLRRVTESVTLRDLRKWALIVALFAICAEMIIALSLPHLHFVSPISPLTYNAQCEASMAWPTVAPSMLINPSFEGQYVTWQSSWNVAPGWTPFAALTAMPPCIAGKPDCAWQCPTNCQEAHPAEKCRTDYSCWLADPEFKQATSQDARRVHGGESAQQAFWYGREGEGGVMQSVRVQPGAILQFSAYVQAWQCAPEYCPHAISDSPASGEMRLRIGVDATGATDYRASSVQWSATCEVRDAWERIAVTATARAPTVTVFLFAQPAWGWAHIHNNAYWDDASLIEIAQPTATPTAMPTATPGPMFPESYLPIALREYPPLPTPTATPTPGQNGLCLQANIVSIAPGESLTITLFVYDARKVQAIETCIFYSPMILRALEITDRSTFATCKIRIWQPGAICYDCESASEIRIGGALYTLQLQGLEMGNALIEAHAFVGYGNGFGASREARPVTVEVK
jgi:hypothetical protein